MIVDLLGLETGHLEEVPELAFGLVEAGSELGVGLEARIPGHLLGEAGVLRSELVVAL